MIRKIVQISAFLAVTACASIAIPPEQLESNEASIRGAEELGAASVPDARLHLEMAKDETANAKRMAAAGDDRAVIELARAESDGELALGLAREVSVHGDAQRASDDLKALQARGTP